MKLSSLLLSICITVVLSGTTSAQFSQPGELDTTFNFGKQHSFFTDPANPQPGEGASYDVGYTAIQPDGKILIGGGIGGYNGISRNQIALLNVDGSLNTSFNPGNGVNGLVQAVALQPDGKVLVWGNFTTYNGIPRGGIARLNMDGSLDSTFNPGSGANNWVYSLALQPDGKVLIGGDFTSYNGTPRIRIARLNTNGSLDTTFNPGTGANNIVFSLAPQPDGKLLIGGSFTNYNTTSRNRIARLNVDGSLDSIFNPGTGANNAVWSLALQPDGKVLIGGFFTTYRGTPRNYIARVKADGGIDTVFNPGTGANGTVRSLALQPNGKVLIGGEFTSYNGTPLNRIARLNSDGSLDSIFNSGLGAYKRVSSLALQPNGKLLIVGEFTSYNGISRNRVARLNTDGSQDDGFNPGTGVSGSHFTNTYVYSLILQPNGKVLIGGRFMSYSGMSRNGIARLNMDGSLDTSFNPGTGANWIVRSIAFQPNGKVLIGGEFTSYNGIPRNRIARLNSDGSLDSTFNPGFGADDRVNSLALQPDGKVLIGGEFTSYNGTSRNRIARLNSNGSLDLTFNPGFGANERVSSLALQSDGKIWIGGWFTNYNGRFLSNIARLNTNGTLDTTIIYGGVSGILITSFPSVRAFALQPDGKVLIGGDFAYYNGISRNRIARLNANGSLDTTFNPGTGANLVVHFIALQPNGKVLISGDFFDYNGIIRPGIAFLNSDGSLDNNSNPGIGTNGSVYTVALQSNGNVLIGGDFTKYNGIYRPRIASLLSTGTITSINELDHEEVQEISTYPIPFQNELRIKVQGPFSYQIIDLRGVVHVSGLSEASEATCFTNDLASGMYLVRITLKGQTYVRKVVKE